LERFPTAGAAQYFTALGVTREGFAAARAASQGVTSNGIELFETPEAFFLFWGGFSLVRALGKCGQHVTDNMRESCFVAN
jgi:hypothetical protein